MLAILAIGAAIASRRPDPEPVPVAVPVATGTLELKADDPEDGITRYLIEKDGIFAVPRDESAGERRRLEFGKNLLPAKEYTLATDSPIVNVAPSKVWVREGKTSAVVPEFESPFPWAYPQIPEKPGARVDYHGTLWYRGLAKEQTLGYDATLRTLDYDPIERKPWRWIELSVSSASVGSKCTETGYLLIDEDGYRASQRLEIKRGWCVASGGNLDQALKLKDPGHRYVGLVAPFDAGKSLSAIVHDKLLITPGDIVSLHEALVLLFGADCPAAGPEIRTLREKIAGDTQRQFDFEEVPGPRGKIPCFLAQSRVAKEEDRYPRTAYKIFRNDAPGRIPFSFVQIDVDMLVAADVPVFRASLKLRGHPSLEAQPGIGNVKLLPPLKELQEQASRVDALPPPSATPFDRATLPSELKRASTTFSGTLTLGNGPLLHYDARITSHGRRVIAGIDYRDLEIDVRSGQTLAKQDSHEVVRLLLDEEEYAKRGKFNIHQSWIECRGETFEFPKSGDLSEMENQLVQLGKPRLAPRVSASDLLTILFDARLPDSRLVNLRDYIKLLRLPGLVQPTPTLKDLPLPSRETVPGEEWLLNLPLVGVSYAIRRSPRIPFDFHSAELNIPKRLVFSVYLPEPKEDKEAVVKDEAVWNRQRDATKNAVLKTAKLNFRVWTWRDDSNTQRKVFGQFGGRVGDEVVLRDRDGDKTIVPRATLSSDDLEQLKRGRIWQAGTYTREANFWLDLHSGGELSGNFGGVLNEEGKVRLILPGGGEAILHREWLSADDRAWLESHPRATEMAASKPAPKSTPKPTSPATPKDRPRLKPASGVHGDGRGK